MANLDWTVVTVYMALVFVIGWRLRNRGGNTEDFFLAGRSMGWFPIGISVMVTMFSAINYLAFPGEVYGHGLYVIVSLPVFFLVAIPVTRIWIPFFHGMKLTSAYEYLEKRFDARVKRLASGIFVFWRLFWMATALFAAGRILGAVTGMPEEFIIVAAGFVAIGYTFLGGIRAVMWTDVLQFFVLFGGIVLGVVYFARGGGIGEMLSIAREGGRLKPFIPFDPVFFSLDPRIRITFWSTLIGVSVAFLSRYGADQVVMQRYFTARNLKSARTGIWLNAVASVFSLSLLAFTGLALYAIGEKAGHAGQSAAGALAHMIRSFPGGITGLIAAGLLSATMSSIDSGMNACSAAWVTDLSPRGKKSVFKRGRWLTVLLGVVAISLALLLIPLSAAAGGLFVMVNQVVNAIGSPLLALFILGMFTRRANASGVFYGGVIGFVASILISLFFKPLALHYYAALNLVLALAISYMASSIHRTLTR